MGIERLQKLANGSHPDSMESNCKGLVDVRHQSDVMALFGSFPTLFLEATAAALAPANRFINLSLGLSQPGYSPQFCQRRYAAIVWNIYDCFRAAVHLDSFRFLPASHFEEEGVESNLPDDFRVIVFVDPASHLRVPDDVPVFFPNEKIGVANNFALDSV